MEIDYNKIVRSGFQEPHGRVYLFQGSDDALKAEGVRRLTSELIDPDFRDFDYEEREIPPSGTSEDGGYARVILSAVATAPMFSKRRVVVATNVQRFKKSDADDLASRLPDICALSCLVLVAGAAEYDAGKVKGSTSTSVKLVNAVQKHGIVVTCSAPEIGDLKTRLADIARGRGKRIEPAAMDLLVDWSVSVGSSRGGGGKTGDINAAVNELEKAIAFIGARDTITREDAAQVSMQGADDNVFRLLDAVSSKNTSLALACADELLKAGGKPDAVLPRTLVMLARQIKMMWGAKFLADNGVNRGNVQKALTEELRLVLSTEVANAMKQPYRLQTLQSQARLWTYDELEQAYIRIAASDIGMKGITRQEALGLKPIATGKHADDLRVLVIELSGFATR